MLRFLKTWLIWLLVLALPAQAVAAAAGSSCASRHHASPMHMGAMSVAHEASATDRQDVQPAHHAASAKADAAAGKHKGGSCSACATCCVGAAVLPAMPDWTPHGANSFIAVVSPLPAFTPHVPARLERPPRPFLG